MPKSPFSRLRASFVFAIRFSPSRPFPSYCLLPFGMPTTPTMISWFVSQKKVSIGFFFSPFLHRHVITFFYSRRCTFLSEG